MHRFNYTVRTKASPAAAWQLYSNWNVWRNFADIYGAVIWTQGKPWEVGSKMDIEIVRPAKATVTRLIISCDPLRELGWIDRGFGMTLGQWVEFDTRAGGGTSVHTWGELVPAGMKFGGRTAEMLLAEFTETWHENYRKACDELTATSGSSRVQANPE